MSTSPVPALSTPSFTASASASSGNAAFLLTLFGNGDMAAAEPVARFLDAVHAAAVLSDTREIIVDLRQVEFMNSSCLKGFVRWLNALQGLPRGRQYAVRFLPNHARPWQRASLLALAGFATDLVSVEELSA